MILPPCSSPCLRVTRSMPSALSDSADVSDSYDAGLSLASVSASAQTRAPSQGLGSLKKLSVEELTNVEVTSVSRRPEALSRVASAIQVITGDEIRRSGATRFLKRCVWPPI